MPSSRPSDTIRTAAMRSLAIKASAWRTGASGSIDQILCPLLFMTEAIVSNVGMQFRCAVKREGAVFGHVLVVANRALRPGFPYRLAQIFGRVGRLPRDVHVYRTSCGRPTDLEAAPP